MVFFKYIITLLVFQLIKNDNIDQQNNEDDTLNRIQKKLKKITREKNALELVKELVYKNFKMEENYFLLDFLLEKNWNKPYTLAIENLYDLTSNSTLDKLKLFNERSEYLVNGLKGQLKKKKKDIVRISPIFEWSQDDNEIKMRIKFAKNLETPGEKNLSNFKVNCTRSQLEVQAYKNHDDYLVHYYRRLNLYEFIRPHTCKSYKETDGTYVIHFHKNQATLFWNFLNQPSEDHYNTFTWMDVHDKYDSKIQYTDFREHAMENLLISDLEQYLNDKTPAKKRRLKRINEAKEFIEGKNKEAKNFCLSPAQEKYCYIPKITEWGYWMS